jgi:hypothetical protein
MNIEHNNDYTVNVLGIEINATYVLEFLDVRFPSQHAAFEWNGCTNA